MATRKSKRNWKATHYIKVGSRDRVAVMQTETGHAYTAEEWADDVPEIRFMAGRDGVWYDHGEAILPECIVAAERDIPVMEDEAAKVCGRMGRLTAYVKMVLKAIDERGEDGYRPADTLLRQVVAEANAARSDLGPAIKAIEEREQKAARDRVQADRERKAREMGGTLPGCDAKKEG